MARHKKIKTVHIEEKPEVSMSDEQQLESLQTELDLARVELQKTKLEIEENKQQLQQVSRRELDDQEKSIVAKQVSRTNESEAKKAVIEAQKAHDNEMVTGRFINRRAPGQPAKLTYMKYADDPVKWWTFEDGKVYSIRRGFADQINDYYHTPQYVQKEVDMDPNRPQSAIDNIDKSNKKYAFVPVAF
jgi:hypothetical protein